MIGEALLRILGKFVVFDYDYVPYSVVGSTLGSTFNKIIKDAASTDYILDAMSGDLNDTGCDY